MRGKSPRTDHEIESKKEAENGNNDSCLLAHVISQWKGGHENEGGSHSTKASQGEHSHCRHSLDTRLSHTRTRTRARARWPSRPGYTLGLYEREEPETRALGLRVQNCPSVSVTLPVRTNTRSLARAIPMTVMLCAHAGLCSWCGFLIVTIIGPLYITILTHTRFNDRIQRSQTHSSHSSLHLRVTAWEQLPRGRVCGAEP